MEPANWQVTGRLAELQVGHQWAASITDWTLTCNQSSMASMNAILRGRVASIDLFWSTQLPIRIRLWMGSAWWAWDSVYILSSLQMGEVVEIKLEGNPLAVPGRPDDRSHN